MIFSEQRIALFQIKLSIPHPDAFGGGVRLQTSGR